LLAVAKATHPCSESTLSGCLAAANTHYLQLGDVQYNPACADGGMGCIGDTCCQYCGFAAPGNDVAFPDCSTTECAYTDLEGCEKAIQSTDGSFLVNRGLLATGNVQFNENCVHGESLGCIGLPGTSGRQSCCQYCGFANLPDCDESQCAYPDLASCGAAIQQTNGAFLVNQGLLASGNVKYNENCVHGESLGCVGLPGTSGRQSCCQYCGFGSFPAC